MSSDQDPFANGVDPFAQNADGAGVPDPFAQITTPAADGNDPFSPMATPAGVPVATPVTPDAANVPGVNPTESADLGKKGKKAKKEKPAKAKKEKVVKAKKAISVNAPKTHRPTGPYTWALWSVLGSCVIAIAMSLFVFGIQYGFAMKP